MELGTKARWVLILAIVSMVCCMVMAARPIEMPSEITDDTETKSELSRGQILAEINKIRLNGKKYKLQPIPYANKGVQENKKPRRPRPLQKRRKPSKDSDVA